MTDQQHPAAAGRPGDTAGVRQEPAGERFAELADRPVAEHVAVFETEHARLQQELSSIDQL
jgi:hypothetical protein